MVSKRLSKNQNERIGDTAKCANDIGCQVKPMYSERPSNYSLVTGR